jgi:hypothetical protein
VDERAGESLGDAFDFMDGYETFWAYIPHFVHSPFYVYAYAFGDGLVNALYAAYADGLPGYFAGNCFRGQVFRHAEARADPSITRIAGALRPGCLGPGLLGQGPVDDRGLHRRVGGDAFL